MNELECRQFVEQVRKGGNATVYAYVHVGVANREDGVDLARRDLFSYAVVDAYAFTSVEWVVAITRAPVFRKSSSSARASAEPS